MKKLLTSLLALMMVLTLSACQGESSASGIEAVIEDIQSGDHTVSCYVEHPELGEVDCAALVNTAEDDSITAFQDAFKTAVFDHELSDAEATDYHSDDLLVIMSYTNSDGEPVMFYIDNTGTVRVTINRGEGIVKTIGSSISESVVAAYDSYYNEIIAPTLVTE